MVSLQGMAKAQGYAVCLSPEAYRAKKEHLRQLLRPRHEIAEPRLPPPRHNVSMEANADDTKPPFLLRPSTQKAASRTAKKANAQGG